MKTPPLPSILRNTVRSAAAPLPAPLRHLAASVPVVLALLMLAALAGCGGGLLGGGDVGGRPDRAQIHGDVERVEAYADEIDIRTDDQRIVTVRYDANTAVYWRGRSYEPTNPRAGRPGLRRRRAGAPAVGWRSASTSSRATRTVSAVRSAAATAR